MFIFWLAQVFNPPPQNYQIVVHTAYDNLMQSISGVVIVFDQKHSVLGR